MSLVTCGLCRTQFDEPKRTPIESRVPCPSCGSKSRLFFQANEGSLQAHSTLRYKAKKGGRGKPFVEGVSGADWSRELKRWMRLERRIDRKVDHYTEIVSDPSSSTVVHRCDEPLGQHIGHGADKKNRSK